MQKVLKVIVNENASRSLLVYFLSYISHATGIWSSVFSLNLMDAWYISVHSEDFWHKWTRDKITDIGGLFLCHYIILSPHTPRAAILSPNFSKPFWISLFRDSCNPHGT